MKITTTYTKRSGANGNRMVIHFDSNLADMLDKEVFTPHVMDLEVKSSAWTSLINKMSKLMAKGLKEQMKGDYKICYSNKAGCQCGCSPGLVVKRHGDYSQPFLEYKAVWMDFEFSEEEIEDFKRLNFPKAFKRIAKEKNAKPLAA